MIEGTIYCATSPSNKKYYGYSINFIERQKSHKKYFNMGVKTRFYDAIKKYGFDNFKWEIIETHLRENKQQLHDILCEREKFWIAKDKTNIKEFGYNLTDGGDGCLGYQYTEEQKQHLSKRLSGAGNPMYGRKHSIESLEKNRQSNLGKKQTEKTKENMRKAHQGLTHTNETKEKMSESWNKRKIDFPMSEETKEKIRLSKQGENHPNWGKKRDPKIIEKIRLSNVGKHTTRIKCVHCGKECTPSTVVRWHNENCKFKV